MKTRTINKTIACVLGLCAALAAATPALAWDPVRDITGKRVDQHAQDFTNSMDKLRRRPLKYPVERMGEIVMDVCSSPLRAYEGGLRAQVRGWRQLPPRLINALARHYPQVNLRDIRYAESISTAGGAAQTFERRIYFPTWLDFGNPSDVHWLLHELEHTVQYERRRGRSTMLCEYMAKAIGNGLRHDSIDMERAADRKADALLDLAYGALNGRYASSY
jgi:hypothetical protein